MTALSTIVAPNLSLTVFVGNLADFHDILKQSSKIRALSEYTQHTLFERRLFQTVSKSIIVFVPRGVRSWPKAYFCAPKHLIVPALLVTSIKSANFHLYHV